MLRPGRVCRIRRRRTGIGAPAKEIPSFVIKEVFRYDIAIPDVCLNRLFRTAGIRTPVAVISQHAAAAGKVYHDFVVRIQLVELQFIAGVSLFRQNLYAVVENTDDLVSFRQRPLDEVYIGVSRICSHAAGNICAFRWIDRDRHGIIRRTPDRIERTRRFQRAGANQDRVALVVGRARPVTLGVPMRKRLVCQFKRVRLYCMVRVVRHRHGIIRTAAGKLAAVSVVNDVDIYRRTAPDGSQFNISVDRDCAVGIMEIPIADGKPADEGFAFRRRNRRSVVCKHLCLRPRAIRSGIDRRRSARKAKVICHRVAYTADPVRIQGNIRINLHFDVEQDQRSV